MMNRLHYCGALLLAIVVGMLLVMERSDVLVQARVHALSIGFTVAAFVFVAAGEVVDEIRKLRKD